MNSDDMAIDFLRLMREEKRRLREEQRRQQRRNETAEVAIPTANTKESPSDALSPPTDDATNDYHDQFWLSLTNHDSISLPLVSSSLSSFDPWQQYCVCRDNPSSINYISRFLEDTMQQRLLQWLQNMPSHDSYHAGEKTCAQQQQPPPPPQGQWNTMKYGKRRVALFDRSSMGKNDNDIWPLPLEQISETLVQMGVFERQWKPNHVLINEYTTSQGILPHTDGPLYYPKTATISIGGSDVLLQFTRRLTSDQIGVTYQQHEQQQDEAVRQIRLEGHGSLVVFCDEAYADFCHGIKDQVHVEYASATCVNAPVGTQTTRGYRISLTFRHKLNSVAVIQ